MITFLVLVVQSCPILCDPTECSPPGSSVHGSLQVRIQLEWIAIPLSKGSSRPKADSLPSEAPGKPHITFNSDNKPYEENTSIPILQILKLSFRKVI